jgi:tRNA nucleotidyltransferase/poly(A) polymerase
VLDFKTMGRLKNNFSFKFPVDEDVFFLLDLIEKNGYKARVVGGAVRDFLLQRKISDVDLASTATPDEIMQLCEKHGLVVIPTGLKHGSVSIILHHKTYEITTLRRDVKTFGRHAEVKFTRSFKMDAARRDFTINAIYMNKKGKIYDYWGGIRDIRKQNIKFIGDPKKRMEEDYLRIFRYFRFVASHGNFRCNKKYLDLINLLKNNVTILSSERIISELLKTLSIPDSHKIIPQMRQILDVLFALTCDAIAVCAEWKILDTLSREERLAMLLKFSGNDIAHIYNFPKFIREMLLLKAVDRTEVFAQLKRTKKEYRSFYAKFLAVREYVCNGSENPSDYLRELLDFCQSEFIDFKFGPDDIADHNLSPEELKNVMIATKKYWLAHNVSPLECKKFAQDIICSRITT